MCSTILSFLISVTVFREGLCRGDVVTLDNLREPPTHNGLSRVEQYRQPCVFCIIHCFKFGTERKDVEDSGRVQVRLFRGHIQIETRWRDYLNGQLLIPRDAKTEET